MTRKRKRSRPERTLSRPIQDTPENIAKAIQDTPPNRREDWKYLQRANKAGE